MADTAADLLTLTRCPCCRYELAGLPGSHTCPECGFAYDESTFALEVWPLDDEPKLGAMAFVAFMTVFFGLLTYSALRVTPASVLNYWPLPALAIFGGALGVMGRRAHLHLKGRGSRVLVVRSKGHALVKGRGEIAYLPWDELPEVLVTGLRRNRWRLTLRRGVWTRLLDDKRTFIFTAAPDTAAAVQERIREYAQAGGGRAR